MLATRYIALSERIAEDIGRGLWKERLPGVMKLGKTLKADPATVLKALKVLEDKNIVTINGKKGTFVTQPCEKIKHRVIGLVGISIDDSPFYSAEFKAIEKVAARNNFNVIGIANNNQLFVNDMELLLQFPVDGYIFMYSSLTREIASFLKRKGMNFVACNKPAGIPGINWVDFEGEAVFRRAFEYLVKLGHKEIAYLEIFNPNYNYSGRIRALYKEISKENGLKFNDSLFISRNSAKYYKVHGESYLYEFGYEWAKEFRALSRRPTAAIVINRLIGQGLCDGLKQYALNVPDDLSVIAYSGCNEHEASLSCVTMDYEKRVEIATAMLIDLIENKAADVRHELIIPEIAIRKSTAKYKGR